MYGAEAMPISHDLIKETCEPFFEQMLTSLEQHTAVHRDFFRTSCKPYFGQMVAAMQHNLHKNQSV